jgi:DNA-binding MarR family transcriptional regulator
MQQLDDDLITILKVLESKGGTDCTGTCHHRQPGEFHCHELGRMLGISSQGVKNRLLRLLRMGLVERIRVERPSGTRLVRFTVSARCEALLEAYRHNALV